MNCLRNGIIIRLCYSMRLLHTSQQCDNIAKAMKKVMNKTGAQNKKSKYYECTGVPTPAAFGKSLDQGKQPRNSRRANVFNKLFMRYITDLMATGECSSYFVGHGIEVSRVQVSPDCTSVNIYWVARGTEKDNIIDNILKNHVGALRHELAQLKVVGVIPTLQFVKDKQYATLAEVDRLLAIADFGDDYEPLDLATRLTTQLQLKTSLDSHTIDKIQFLDQLDDNNQMVWEEPVPAMPQNIFNLNHSEIMENIIKSKRKTKAPNKLSNDMPSVVSYNENAITFANAVEERAAFQSFLHKRQILKEKSYKVDKNYDPGLEYLRDEWLERQKTNDDFIDVLDDNDYMDDESDKS